MNGPFDPYSIESHYSLEMASYFLHQERPRTVRICTPDARVAQAAVRRLGWVEGALLVETAEISRTIRDQLGVETKTGESGIQPEAVFIPDFSQTFTPPPPARAAVVVSSNALSYKSLRSPGQVRNHILRTWRWFNRSYRVTAKTGLLGPRFTLLWASSLLAGARLSWLHFYLGQKAMDRLFTTGPTWWLGTVTVLAGRRRG
jgi:hypothetical protein